MPEERKLVTILFADVTGSTSLGEALDPEDLRALMGRYYGHARRIIVDHGGTIEKFIGDAVMAVFGLKRAHSDDAERALAAALALRAAIASDDVLDFQLRIGVNTGEVVATNDHARSDFLVTGDAVNIAARLQQSAYPDEIVAGERTMHAAHTAFLFGEARLVEVKGKRQPLRVFPLLRRHEVRKATRPPFVGRKQDLLQLSLLQARVLEERRPQLVSIVAPTGTGKTRLLEEFLQRLDTADGFRIATVRCLPYGQTLTYWPLQRLLEDVLQQKQVTKPAVVQCFVRAGYRQEDADRLAGLILATFGVECEDTCMPDSESIQGAWRLLLEALARQAPFILVFEDLHWASNSLLDLVEYMLHLRSDVPVFAIVLSRPELLERRPSWGGGRQNFTALALPPLTPAYTYQLVTQLKSDLPEATRTKIVERSGGNPFFALELVQGLLERGLTEDAAVPDALPDTVHAAVLARLDLLAHVERQVLQVAAVANPTIVPAMLQAVLDEYTPAEIDCALDRLLQYDLLQPGSDETYGFRHILIRDVAYGTLTRAERMRLHGRIAVWLESRTEQQFATRIELIAYHYYEAIRLYQQAAVRQRPPVEIARAIHYLTDAGELAGRAGAFKEASTYLQWALQIAPEHEHIRLYELLGDNLGWTISGVEAYQKALAGWRQHKVQDPLTGARLLRKILICYTRGSCYETLGTEYLQGWRAEARQLVEQSGDEEELWRLRVVDLFAKRILRKGPSYEELRHVAQAAVSYFEQRSNWLAVSEALDGFAGLSFEMGAFTDALEASRRRLAIPHLSALEYGDALHMAAYNYANLEEYDRCITLVENELDKLRPGQPVLHLAMAFADASFIACATGQWETMDMWMRRVDVLQIEMQYDAPYFYPYYLAALSMASAREDQATYDAFLARIQQVMQRYLKPDLQIFLHALFTGDLQAARQVELHKMSYSGLYMLFLCNEKGVVLVPECLDASLSDREDQKFSGKTLTAFRWAYEIARALAADDNTWLARAIDEAEQHQLIVHAARMRILLAQRSGDGTQLERAQPVLERLQDRRSLRKLQEVARALGQGV